MRVFGCYLTNACLSYGSLPPVPDMLSPLGDKMAKNGNRGSIQPYQVFGRVPVTGLIGALLITFSRISDLRD